MDAARPPAYPSLVRRAPSSPGLWPILLAIVVALVVADFIHHPFIGGTRGDAAPRESDLTLWLARSEAGSANAATVRLAAGYLGKESETPSVGELEGGSAAALEHFAGRSSRRGVDLFAVTSTTLADLARDRHETLLPEARERAARAEGLLSEMVPVALLCEEPLRLLASRESRLTSSSLRLGLVRRPWGRVFGVPDDAWIEGQFAALVQGSETPGGVPYSASPDPQNTLLSLAAGDVGVALVPGSEGGNSLRSGAARPIAWPDRKPPAAWVALFARAGTPRPELHALRARARRLSAGRRWRHALVRNGRRPVDQPSAAALRSFLRTEERSAAQLQALSARLRSRR
jgi:hypothetical protein